MGKYRFLLSIFVALSHIGTYFAGINQGVVSVVSFLLISGFTMQKSADKFFREEVVRGRQIINFYFDRIMRIYPQYIFFCVLTVIYVYFFSIPDELNECMRTMNFRYFIKNLLIFPVGSRKGLDTMIIPAAWTLALEFKFYLLYPFIYKYKLQKISLLLSGAVFTLAFVGKIDTAWFGYKSILGMLFIFMTGCILGSKEFLRDKKWVLGVWSISIFFIVRYLMKLEYHLGFNREIILGLILGIPMILFLKDDKMTRLDHLLGSLSYGIYLNHYQIKYVMRMQPINLGDRLVFFSISIVLALVAYVLIEKPLTTIRRDIRERQQKEIRRNMEGNGGCIR